MWKRCKELRNHEGGKYKHLYSCMSPNTSLSVFRKRAALSMENYSSLKHKKHIFWIHSNSWSFCRICTWSQLCSFSPCLSSFLATPAVSFQKKPISYSLLINPSSLFSISAETGEISLTRPIDYESDQHRYLLLVRASEGIESMSSAAEVCVYIYIYIYVCLCICMLVSLRCKFQEKKGTFSMPNPLTSWSQKIGGISHLLVKT